MSVSFKTETERRCSLEHMSENDLRALPNIGPAIAKKPMTSEN